MEIDWQQLGETAARGLFVYALMLLVIRLLGKRTVGNFTAFDLLVALMLGEVVDEMIYGDVTLAQGSVAIVVVAGAKYLTAWLTYFGHGMDKILEGTPTEIVRDGRFLQSALRKEVIHEREAFAALRLHGINDLREVKTAVLEVDGEISVVREEWAEPLQKGDVLQKAARERKESPGSPSAAEETRTDTPRALGRE